jgi:catechol 2,3-dioxygenase-like lactoylglutathione lyase family enzyme
MKIDKITPCIYTTDFEKTVYFYTQILGFHCLAKDAEYGWAKVCHDKVEIMISLPNEMLPFEKPLFTGSFYFATDSIDELWLQLKEKTNVSYPLENFDYGMREFAIFDNNGYLLQFGQEINEPTL